MTIEEKARAYDKALNIAREILDHTSENYLCTHLTKEDIKNMYIRFFPELEESEDEKIRKSLISYLHGLGEFDYPDKKTYNDWLKWLEKQKGYVSPQMVADAYLRGCNETEEKLLEKQDEQKNKINSYKITFEDVLALECAMKTVKITKGGNELYEMLVLLYNKIHNVYLFEKQGEQKLQIEKLPSEMKTIGESLNFTSQEECDEYNQMVSDLIMSNSDKIEPKFKVGDWITNGDYTWKIVEVKPLDYMLQSQNGNIVYDTISYVDEQFHSFTIQDAKDGDVLCDITNKNVLIFNEISNGWVRCLCSVHLEDSCCLNYTELYGREEQCSFAPATKEQRGLLFKKMKEAGYEWNSDTKELKKIHVIDEGKAEMDYCFTKMMNGEKVSPAWSEEDEEIMSGLLSFLLINTSDQWAKYGKWILSLKERMRR